MYGFGWVGLGGVEQSLVGFDGVGWDGVGLDSGKNAVALETGDESRWIILLKPYAMLCYAM